MKHRNHNGLYSVASSLRVECGNFELTGRPLFWSSFTITQPAALPRQSFVQRSRKSSSLLMLNTRAQMSGRSEGLSPGKRDSVISGQAGLHVIVMRYAGFPSCRTEIKLRSRMYIWVQMLVCLVWGMFQEVGPFCVTVVKFELRYIA